MPATEPWAISEPFSTAGKINMNYEIMPFRYVSRRTGIHALMKGIKMGCLPEEAADPPGHRRPSYKEMSVGRHEFRWDVNLDRETGTLRGFERRFEEGDIFRSSSEICEIFPVPHMDLVWIGNVSSRFVKIERAYHCTECIIEKVGCCLFRGSMKYL